MSLLLSKICFPDKSIDPIVVETIQLGDGRRPLRLPRHVGYRAIMYILWERGSREEKQKKINLKVEIVSEQLVLCCWLQFGSINGGMSRSS